MQQLMFEEQGAYAWRGSRRCLAAMTGKTVFTR